MEKYSLSQHLTTANNLNGRRSIVCKCSEGHTTTTHQQQVTYPGHPDYFYKKLPVSPGRKSYKDLRRREAKKETDDNGQYRSIKVKSKGARIKDNQEVEVEAVKRAEPQVVKEVKREAVGRSGLLRRTESEEEEEERRRVSLRRLARVANWHHLPRVATKPRSLSAASSSSCSSLLSASRKSGAQQRTSSVAKILPSPSIRSFSSSSRLQYSSSYRPTSYLNHISNKMSVSTSNLPNSPLSYSPTHLSLSSSSVLEFSSSFSSLEEGDNMPEEKNRDVDVYLQVPPTILVSSNRGVVETGRFLSNSSSFRLQEAWAG